MTQTAPEPGADDPLGVCGVVPPTLTVFDDRGRVNAAATAAHAAFVVDRGAEAVFPLGTNGEFALLDADERRRVVETVVDAVDAPVIAGVGCPSTRATVANAEHAESVGADGVVAVTPYYYPIDGEGAVAHYRAVADSVDVPVYVYHIPSKTGNEGVKDSSKNVPWLAQAIDSNPELTFLAGSDSLLFAGLEIGCSGVVSAVANVFPELVVDLYAAYADGEETRARELQSTVFDVRSALKRGPYMAGVKTALSLRGPGFDVGGLRAPLRGMDDADRAALETELTELGLL